MRYIAVLFDEPAIAGIATFVSPDLLLVRELIQSEHQKLDAPRIAIISPKTSAKTLTISSNSQNFRSTGNQIQANPESITKIGMIWCKQTTTLKYVVSLI